MDEPDAAWTLIQVSALLRTADELLLESMRTLGPELHAGFAEDAQIAIAPEQLERLDELLAELADASDQLRVLGDCLPDERLELRYDELRASAAEELAAGTADPARALLAARVLGVADGWQALASALLGSDAHLEWGPTTVMQLLRRFRGTNAEQVGAVLEEAGLDEHATFAACPPRRLVELARVLEAHAAERR